ncbi:hypothetical protein AGMMS49982_21210 [Bacteroidia bacterium]|nr:hypothetical protein AGMMS49982_21210 [Bacteroidia bacterium]
MASKIEQVLLLGCRKLYDKGIGRFEFPPLERETNINRSSDLIYNQLASGKPCMISRFGATEIASLTNYLGVKNKSRNTWKVLTREEPEWWWNENLRTQMTEWSGFFPSTDENLARFGELMLEDVKQLDILVSWLSDEARFVHLFPQASFIHLICLHPFWAENPWTRYLENKKVLVVHPFSDEIESQYKNNRTKLFQNENVLPPFELITYKAVQSIGGSTQFASWFDALQHMKDEIDRIDYDVCLLGCGAYGMPLAAHIKRTGKQAVHVGGALQLFFGIIGKRWEDNLSFGADVLGEKGKYAALFNEYWIRPGKASIIPTADKVENACYW